tara:strand:- start:684 stop:1283 length:600 start_codon:yes stop_codon:yes gene_type:complete
MFFYLLYNSNLITEYENKIIKIIIYGIILYIVSHILINNMTSSNYLGYYFWIIFILDCISISSLVITETNGGLLINNIKNINKQMENIIKQKNKIKEITRIETNLNNETNPINNKVLDNEQEFNKFMKELNLADSIEHNKVNDKNVLDKPDPIKPMDERERIRESLKPNIKSIGEEKHIDINIDSDIEIDINDFDDFIK